MPSPKAELKPLQCQAGLSVPSCGQWLNTEKGTLNLHPAVEALRYRVPNLPEATQSSVPILTLVQVLVGYGTCLGCLGLCFAKLTAMLALNTET